MRYCENLQFRDATIEELEALEVEYPSIHKTPIECIEHFEIASLTAKNVLRYEFISENGDEVLFWPFFLKETIEKLSEVIWFYGHQPQIEQELRVVKDKCLMEMMQNEKSSRMFDDLRRYFYRILSKPHKHQEWNTRCK